MTVIAAFSPDDYGRAALDHAAALAVERQEKLVVVNATTGGSLVDRRYAHEDEVAAIVDRLGSSGLEVEVRRDVVLEIADAVLEAAEQENASVVVVGVRRRTPVGKMLLGSVAQRVILEAPCPVLAVKP